MKKIILFGAILLVFSGCEKELYMAELDEAMEIKVDETLEYNNENLKIEFLKVEDSRCPADAYCFWAGNVVATVLVNDISISLNSDTILDTLGYVFSLGIVAPVTAASSDDNYKQKDYILSLVVTK